MSFNFAYVGSLMEETTRLLSNLNEQHDWKEAEKELYNSGLVFSVKSTERIVSVVKLRFKTNEKLLPDLNSVINVAKSNMNSISKAEIYYVYLYESDEFVSTIANYLGEIYENNTLNPHITRTDIRKLFLLYLERNKKKFTSKSVENWIGRFLTLLKEINILIPKSKSSYIMNLGGFTIETWTFFLLHAYFENYNPLESCFVNAFQLKEHHINKLIEWSNTKNWVKCKLQETDNKIKYIKINANYSSLIEWFNDL